MAKKFPTAHEAFIQLLYDRHDSLYDSDHVLETKVEPLVKEIVASRPVSNTSAFEHLEFQYTGLRLRTLLGLEDPGGVFTATIPYDGELLEELSSTGDWKFRISDKGMEISNKHHEV